MTRADAIRDCLHKILDMSTDDAIRDYLHKILDMSTDDQIAQWLLSFARRCPVDASEVYSLWCDNQGACKGRDCEELEDCCSDEEHTACILRFLQGEYVKCL